MPGAPPPSSKRPPSTLRIGAATSRCCDKPRPRSEAAEAALDGRGTPLARSGRARAEVRIVPPRHAALARIVFALKAKPASLVARVLQHRLVQRVRFPIQTIREL